MRLLAAGARAPSARAALAAIVLFAAAEQQPRLLADLSPGDELVGRIKAHHSNKVYFAVPVQRPGSGGKLRPVDAYVSLPPTHELLKQTQASIGKTLTCYVLKAQPDSARLSVDLRPPEARRQKQRPKSARELEAADWPLQLETVAIGTSVTGTISSVRPFGAFVQVDVSRAGRRGERRPVDACLLPTDQMDSGVAAKLAVGQTLELRVLKSAPAQGRLMLTARDLDAAEMTAQANTRAATRKRLSRRASLASLARTPGAKREGVITRLEPYGAVVNVGARRPGLIHISQLGLDPSGEKGRAFVGDASDVVDVGDQVVVEVLPRSNEKRLSLRLVRVFPRDDDEARSQQATLRAGETLRAQYSRAEDAPPPATTESAAIDAAASEDAAWAAYEAMQQAAGEADEEEDPFAWAAADAPTEEEEDPFAWAAADAPAPPAPAAEEEDPFAWAAADAPAPPAGPKEVEDEEEEGEEFDEDYFNDKYEQDFY